jgi:hypothetical protein
MDFDRQIRESCLVGRGRRGVAAALAAVLALILILPQPAGAQREEKNPIVEAAGGVVSYIENTIGSLLQAGISLLGQINGTAQSFWNLWTNVVYPAVLIAQAQGMVRQLIAQDTGLTGNINNINVLSATLPTPIALEQTVRNGSAADFAQFSNLYRQNYQPVPATGTISPGDQQRVDASDAFAMDVLKEAKASDSVVVETLQAAQLIENEATQDAPGSAPYLSGAGLIAAVENQASMQRMLAAELRQEAATLAHINALRKRASNMSDEVRRNAISAFQ